MYRQRVKFYVTVTTEHLCNKKGHQILANITTDDKLN